LWCRACCSGAERRDSTARHNFDRRDVGTKSRIAAAKAESQLTLEGERKTVTALFADIYGWFTQGFNTADLRDAKALLDELSN
jgi:hypothetical protein